MTCWSERSKRCAVRFARFVSSVLSDGGGGSIAGSSALRMSAARGGCRLFHALGVNKARIRANGVAACC